MLSLPHTWTRRLAVTFVLMVALFCSTAASPAFAQDQEQPSLAIDVAKHTLFDPTTYAPALFTYTATMRDWNTSQPFFQQGYLEHNARFTVSGRPDDIAIPYGDGRHRILMDAIGVLQISLVNNVTSRVIDRVLIENHPEHRTLFRTLGWIERVGFASYMSYRLSASHIRQAQLNQQRMSQLSIR